MYHDLGEKVKQLRKRKRLIQDDLGLILCLSKSQVSNLESRRRNLTLKQLEKLCDYFIF